MHPQSPCLPCSASLGGGSGPQRGFRRHTQFWGIFFSKERAQIPHPVWFIASGRELRWRNIPRCPQGPGQAPMANTSECQLRSPPCSPSRPSQPGPLMQTQYQADFCNLAWHVQPPLDPIQLPAPFGHPTGVLAGSNLSCPPQGIGLSNQPNWQARVPGESLRILKGPGRRLSRVWELLDHDVSSCGDVQRCLFHRVSRNL